MIINQEVKAVVGMVVMGASASVEQEFHKSVPDQVQIVTARVPLGEVSYEGLREMTDRLPEVVGILMGARPDMIAITNMTGSCIRGNEMVNTLQQITGVPVLLPPFEFVQALKLIGAKQIAIASTFARELNLVERLFFENRDIQVTDIINLRERYDKDPYTIGEIDYEAIVETMMGRDYSGVDAVIFDHPIMNLNTGVEKELEKILPVPFFSINQVLVYSVLERIGESTDHLYISKFLKNRGGR